MDRDNGWAARRVWRRAGVRDGVVCVEALESRRLLAALVADEPSAIPGWNGASGAFADFDGDGIGDALGVAGGRWELKLGNARGGFDAAAALPVIGEAGGDRPRLGQIVVAGMFTEDDVMDVVVVRSTMNRQGLRVRLLVGDGEGGFAAGRQSIVMGAVMPERVRNREGWSARLAGEGEPESVVLRLKQQLVTFSLSASGVASQGEAIALNGARVIGIEDFDGDGVDELAVRDAGRVELWLLGGDPGVERRVVYAPVDGVSGDVTIGDVEGDGRPDLLLVEGREVVELRRPTGGDAGGEFARIVLAELSNGGRAAIVAAVGEVNGDGQPDLLVTVGSVESGRIPTEVFEGLLLISDEASGYVERSLGSWRGGYALGELVVAGLQRGLDLGGDGLMDVIGASNLVRRVVAEGANAPATIASLRVTEPNPLTARREIIATGVNDDGRVSRVEFWFDRNDNGVVDSSDVFVGRDGRAGPAGGYRRLMQLEHQYGGSGQRRFLARAIDDLGFWGETRAVDVVFP